MSVGPSQSISVHQEMEVVDDVCRATLRCADPSVFEQVVVLVLSAVLAVIVIAAILQLREAQSIVDREQERARSERDAFADFAQRVSAVDASAQQSVASTGPIATMSAAPPDRGLERIEDAYHDTVMAVPHYEEDYDEPALANMAAELGEEVATTFATESQLTPQLKQGLLAKTTEARDRRTSLLEDLQREAQLLAEADDDLKEIDADLDAVEPPSGGRRPFGTLLDDWDRLDRIESRLQSVLETRQDRVHDHRATVSRVDQQALFYTYLYGTLDSTYPVLSAGTDLLERLQSIRRDVLQSITSSG